MSVPLFRTVLAEADHAAQATAGTTESFVIGEAQINATVTEVSIVPNGPLTADATNNRTFTITNTGQAGAGVVAVATLITNVAGGNWVAFDEKLATLSGTAANLTIAAGDVLSCVETIGGTGVAHPAFQIVVRGTQR
jgi:hypothetical protein